MTGGMEIIADMIDGKHVALVGNASSLLKEGKAEEIDDHEVVIRINRGLAPKVPAKYIGSRVDLWVTARRFANVKREQFKAILFMKLTPLGDRDWKDFQGEGLGMPLVRWPQKLADECIEFCNCDPGCGLRMLWLLKRKLSPKSVDVYGMDCWKTKSTLDNGWNPALNHNPDRERELVELLCKPSKTSTGTD